ncbi:MAG: Gfo/Idh/MocA family oxidoreductase [Tepidisphaeraceae bacterium]
MSAEIDPIRVAIVGTGHWGRHHARAFAARSDVVLCGIAGRDAGRAAQRAEEFQTAPYTDIERMIEHEKPDLVAVCLPDQHHFEATRRVIASGTPLFVEKPLTYDLVEADTLIAEAEAQSLFFAINFNHRYAKPAVLAYEAICEGRVGEIIFVTRRFGTEGRPDHPFNCLIETQCHGFDLLEHLCGPIISIMAQMTDKTHHGVYRTAALALKFENGAVGTMLGSYDASHAHSDAQRLEICGTRGRVLVEDTVRRFTYSAQGNETAEVWQAGYFNDRDRSFHQTMDFHVADMLNHLRRGLPPPIHARAGRRALRLALAAIESFREGRRVAVANLDAANTKSFRIGLA